MTHGMEADRAGHSGGLSFDGNEDIEYGIGRAISSLTRRCEYIVADGYITTDESEEVRIDSDACLSCESERTHTHAHTRNDEATSADQEKDSEEENHLLCRESIPDIA